MAAGQPERPAEKQPFIFHYKDWNSRWASESSVEVEQATDHERERSAADSMTQRGNTMGCSISATGVRSHGGKKSWMSPNGWPLLDPTRPVRDPFRFYCTSVLSVRHGSWLDIDRLGGVSTESEQRASPMRPSARKPTAVRFGNGGVQAGIRVIINRGLAPSQTTYPTRNWS